MIDLRRLHVLRAVAYHGTVTAAATALHLTPFSSPRHPALSSAASQQIRQLGRDLGVTLLEPHGRRVFLTPAARSLLEHADAIEERWQRAEADLAAADPSSPAGSLRLCGTPTAISAFLAPVTARLRERWPGLAVYIREAEPWDCYDLVFAGDADVGVTLATPDNPPASDPRFEQRRLFDEPHDLLTTPDHRLAGAADVTLADLADEPWILCMPDTAPRQMTLALCNAAGFTPTVAHDVMEWTAVANLVGHGLGVTIIPRLTRLPEQPTVARTPLSPAAEVHRRFLTVTRKGGRAVPATAAALDLLDELASSLHGR